MSAAVFFISWIAFSGLMSVFIENKWLIFLWVPLGYVVGIILFITFITILLAIFNINPDKTSKLRVHYMRNSAWVANNFIFNLHISVINASKVPKDGICMCYCNHRSMIDALILLQIFKRRASFSPKDSLYKIGYLRMWFKFLRTMKVTRNDDRATLKEMIKSIDHVRQGDLMIMFPEGTTKNHETEMMEGARNGAYKMAQKALAAIVPVSMFGTHKIRKNSPWLRTRVTIKFHDPIPYDEIKNLKTFEIDAIVENIINQGIIELQSEYSIRHKLKKSADKFKDSLKKNKK